VINFTRTNSDCDRNKLKWFAHSTRL